jgi:general secretion pathway protein G
MDHNVMKSNTKPAFTIVELLVVIVVIGILAAITIVTYAGISDKAKVASLQSDLTSASTKLKLYQTDNSAFPSSLTLSSGMYCPSPADTRYCVKASSGNTLTYSPGDGSNPLTYVLTATNNTTNYTITNNSQPIATAPNSPVADWLALSQGEHYGNYYDLVGKTWATVTRSTPKTIYDPNTQHIYDVPANYLGINPRSDGKSGSEAVIEEARTNLFPNTDFETGLSSWSGIGGNISQDSSMSVHGTSSMKFTANALNGRPDAAFSVTGGLSYTFSAFIWAPSGYNSLQLETYDVGNSTGYDTNILGNNTWTRYSVTFTASSGTPSIYLRVVDRASSGWQSFYADAFQFEQGLFATSYIPTTTATVTRNSDVVAIPTASWNLAAGSIFGVYPGSAYQSYRSMGMSTGNGKFFTNDVIGYSYFYNQKNGGGWTTSYGTGATAGVYSVLAGTWTSASGIQYVNGTPNTPSSAAVDTSTPFNANAYIGGTGASFFDGPVQRMIIYNSSLSTSDVNTVTNLVKNGP